MGTPLCARCKLRAAHRLFDSGRGLCGQCYAQDRGEGASPAKGGALARTARAVQPARNFDLRVFEAARAGNGAGAGLMIPFTRAVSLALWRGLSLEAQHAILQQVLSETAETRG